MHSVYTFLNFGCRAPRKEKDSRMPRDYWRMHKALESLAREKFFFTHPSTKSPYKNPDTNKNFEIFFFLAKMILELYRTNKFY